MWGILLGFMSMVGYVSMDVLYLTIDVDDDASAVAMAVLAFLVVVASILSFLSWAAVSHLNASRHCSLGLLAETLNIFGSLCYLSSALLTFSDADTLATTCDQMALFVFLVDCLMYAVLAFREGACKSPCTPRCNPDLWGHVFNVAPQLLYLVAWAIGVHKVRTGRVLPQRRRAPARQRFSGPVRATRSSNMDGIVTLCYFIADVLFLFGAAVWAYGFNSQTDDPPAPSYTPMHTSISS